MGTWDYGLLDNDTAADAMDEVMSDVLQRAVRTVKSTLSRRSAGELAAQLGLLVHYWPWSFDTARADSDRAAIDAVRDGMARNRAVLDEVAPEARELLDRLASGKPLPKAPRFEALLRATHARPYLQELADDAIEEADSNLEDGSSAAQLDLLRVLAPHVELPARTMRHWLRRCREAFAEADDDERMFRRAHVEACKVFVSAASAEDDDDEHDDE
ncbi:MAG: DUF4259 domain-containing protein [Acidobacteriota bacterium]